MKKVKFFACVCGVALLTLFVSCKNFLQGSNLLEMIDETILYANAKYVDVTINANATSTDLVSPIAGRHSGEYKAKDRIALQFTAKLDYQFVNWYAEPSDSVQFANASESSTEVRIVSDSEPIVITPKVYERPTVSFSPSANADSVAKNTQLILTFSQAMNLTEEDLEQIKISMDNVSVLDNFQKPYLTEDKTQVIFKADRHNMIVLESGEKKIDVFVPNTFFHTEEDANVTLGRDYYHSYKINSQTNDNANVTFDCAAEYGKLSYNGTKKFYLDNSLDVSFTPDRKYKITGWSVKYSDETKVDPSVLTLTASEDLCNIKVTLLDGSLTDIKVSPIVEIRPVMKVTSPVSADGESLPRDTPIIIEFDKNMSADNDLSRITITSNGNVYAKGNNDKFLTPQWLSDHKTVVIYSNKKNLLDVEADSTRIINVMVPGDFYYETNDKKHIELGTDINFSYVINKSTNDKLTLNLIADENYGTVKSGGSDKYNLNSHFDIVYDVKNTAQFIRWNISTDVENIIKTTEKIDGSTYTLGIDVVGAGFATVSAIVQPRPSISNSLIQPADVKAGQPMDSEFSISVDKKVNAAAIESGAEIRCDGMYLSGEEAIEQYFTPKFEADPVENKGMFRFIPTTEYDKITSLRNLLDISSIAAKYITVSIPKEAIYYEYKETETSEPIKIYAYEDFTYSYRVNYQTNDKIFITFADSESSYGTRSGSMTGVYYYLGDEVTVGFQPSEAAFFDGWKITYYDENENEIQDSNALELQSGYALEDKSIKFTVKENCARAVIQPLAHFKQTVKVSFNGPNGNIFPAGTREQWFEGDSINLTFTANSDYAFVGWKIYKEEDPNHALTKEQIKALHLDFGDADLFWENIQDKGQSGEMNVSFNFKSETPGEIPDYSKNIKLIIKAETELRPKVTQTIPANGSSGNVRNTSIKIAFSEPMTNVFGEGQVNPVVVAEGIQTVSSEDIYLDTKPVDSKIDSFSLSESGKLLSIKLKTGEYFSKLYYVTVKIPKTFTSAKGITMASDYSMQFQVSDGVDTEAPEITTLRVGKGISSDGKNEFNNITKGSLEDFTNTNRKDKFNQPIKTINDLSLGELQIINSNEKLNLYVYAQDITSPDSDRIEGNVGYIGYRIKNCSFKDYGISTTYNTPEFTGTIKYDINTRETTDNGSGLDGLSNDKGITCSLDLDEAGVPDGLLKVDIYAIDINDNNTLANQNRNPDSNSNDNNKLEANNGLLTFYIIKKSKAPVVTSGEWQKNSKAGSFSRDIDNEAYKYVNNKNLSVSLNVDNSYKSIKTFKFEVKDSNENIVKTLQNVGYKAFREDNTEVETLNNDDTGELVLRTDEVLHTAKLTFNEISEDLEEGDYTCNVIIGDDQGNIETKAIPFTVDNTPPEVKSPKVESYSYTSGTNEKNVWPRVGKQGVTSLEFWDEPSIVNGDGNLISFYYTNAYKKAIVNTTYGVNLAFEDEDNSQQIPFHLYFQNSSSTNVAESTMCGDNYKAAKIIASGTKTSVTQHYFGEGTYSFVAVDEAGNVSKAHTVIIVKDSTKPSNAYNDGHWLKDYALRGGESNVAWSNASGDTWWGRNATGNAGASYWNFWDNGSHSSQGMYTCVITLKGSNVKNATIKFPMTGNASGYRYDNQYISINSNNCRYEDFKPSRTNAGIVQYIVGRRWANWNTHDDDPFVASVYMQEYFDCDYHKDSFSFQIYKDYNQDKGLVGTLYNKQGPIHFGLVDGCGNELNCQKLDYIGRGDTWNYAFWLEY